jgi:hypothetical protein
MIRSWLAGAVALVAFTGLARAESALGSPVVVEVVAEDGSVFRQFPVRAQDAAQRAYLEAERGARYRIRVRNTTGERLGLVVAVDGRNIINGARSDLSRSEPMYVLDAWSSEDYAGWRANLEAINEFYFTDWKDSYAEAFGDRSARGVIAVAVYREVQPREPRPRLYSEEREGQSTPPAATAAPSVAQDRADKAEAGAGARRAQEKSAGTGYGDRRVDRAVEVEFLAQSSVDSRHFLKYEWRETLCRKQVIECGESNRFWDERTLGFAPPPPRRTR